MYSKGRSIRITCYVFLCQVISILSQQALDPNVFKSLERTELKSLKGVYESKRVRMDYTLDKNIINEVYAETGKFEVDSGKLLARLPKTNGTISGLFKTGINVNVPKKSTATRLVVAGTYIARIEDVDLHIAISLPKSAGEPMKLDGCNASVSILNLALTPKDKDDEGLVNNLKEWLTEAMLPSFSELFCDTMEKILAQGMASPVFRALYLRSCSILGGPNCPPREGN